MNVTKISMKNKSLLTIEKIILKNKKNTPNHNYKKNVL